MMAIGLRRDRVSSLTNAPDNCGRMPCFRPLWQQWQEERRAVTRGIAESVTQSRYMRMVSPPVTRPP